MVAHWQENLHKIKQCSLALWHSVLVKKRRFCRRQPIAVGIDIGSSAVKLIALSKPADSYVVEHYAVVPLPVGTIVEHQIKDVAKVTMAIKRLLQRAKLPHVNPIIALPDALVIAKTIQMDAQLTQRMLAMDIMFEAEKHIPHAIEDVNLDYSVLGASAKNMVKNDVLLVVSPRNIIEQRLAIFQAAGLTIEVIEVESFALQRCLSLLQAQLSEPVCNDYIAIVDIGASMMNIYLIHHQQIVYTHQEALGTRQLVAMIARHYQLSSLQAEALMLSTEVPDDYPSTIMKPFAEHVVQQVQRHLHLLLSSYPGAILKHVLFAGGMTHITTVVERLQNTLNVPLCVADPLSDMAISAELNPALLHDDSACLLVAIGLALRGINND